MSPGTCEIEEDEAAFMKDEDPKEMTIIVPVYNEQDSLPETIEQMVRLQEKRNPPFSVLFVNDGSTDKTKEILENMNIPGFRVIHHNYNSGYGASIKTGIAYSESEYICITDADGTYPNYKIPDLFSYFSDKCSMVVGSRNGDNVHIPFLRRFPKWILNSLANYLTGIKIPDINSGLRIMKRNDVVKFIGLMPDGFSFTTTITIAMLTNNMEVHFVPIDYYKRKGTSKIKPISDTISFFQLIIRTCLYFKPLKVFVPLSMALVFFAFFLLIGSWALFGRPMDMTFGITIMSAVVLLAIGMLADLINKRIQS